MDASIRDEAGAADRGALLTRAADPQDEAFTVVLRAVADVSGTPLTDLRPIADVVDPDALEGLFPSGRGDGRVVFRYEGFTIAVGADRTVRVYEAPGSAV